MLSKNSTLVMFAVLLFSHASIIFTQVDEEANVLNTVKKAAAVYEAINATEEQDEYSNDEIEVMEEDTQEIAE